MPASSSVSPGYLQLLSLRQIRDSHKPLLCVCVCMLVAQLCLILYDPMDCSWPGSFPWDSRQEYWSGLPFPSSGDLPDPGIKPRSPALQTDSLPSEPTGKPQPPLRFDNFLEQCIELRETCLLVYYIIINMMKDIDSQMKRERSGNTPSAGASVPMELARPSF